MEARGLAALLGALVLLGGFGAGAARDVGAEVGIAAPAFGGEVFVSTSDRIGEPGVKVALDNTVYVHAPGRVWRSDDGGATWKKLQFAFGVNPCGCDADVAIDVKGNIFYADLAVNLGCVAVASSLDRGQKWLPNPLACGADGGTFVDRQWIESDGGLNVYLTFYGSSGLSLARAPLAPAPVFVNLQSGFNSGDFVQWNGYLAVDRNSQAVYATYNTIGDDVVVHRSLNAGLTLERVVVASNRGDTFDSFTVPAVDDTGNVYIVWTERVEPDGRPIGTDVWFASSTDQGATWSQPLKVNQVPFTTTYPWIVAGSDGRVGIAYYGSMDKAEPNIVKGDWFVYYAFSDNAHSASPAFTEVLAVPHKVKTGPICTAGTGCGNTREFLDFFGVHMFPDGRAVIAFNDQTGLSQGQNPWVKFVKQVAGPLLRNSAPPPPSPPLLPLGVGLVDLLPGELTKGPRTTPNPDEPAGRAPGIGPFRPGGHPNPNQPLERRVQLGMEL